MRYKLVKDMTPEEHEKVKKAKRDWWQANKKEVNRKRSEKLKAMTTKEQKEYNKKLALQRKKSTKKKKVNKTEEFLKKFKERYG